MSGDGPSSSHDLSPSLWRGSVPPFDFSYGGRTFSDIREGWECKTREIPCAEGRRQTVAYRSKIDDLLVEGDVTELAEPSAVRWTLHLENRGAADTPVLERILPLHLRLGLPAGENLLLHSARGNLGRVDDFLPWTERLIPGSSKTVAPEGGRSSQGAMPFLNLQWPGGGMLLAIGWSGQWMARFERTRTELLVQAGMERTRLVLHPKERIRTPQILLVFWKGDDPEEGNRALRRLMLRHHTPRDSDGAVRFPPVAHTTYERYMREGILDEARELRALERAGDLGLEAYWVDAGWFGGDGNWWENVGSWQANPRRFPRGLRPIGDAAHARGMKFVVWFEPERVRLDSFLDREKPGYLLRCARTSYHTYYRLFNLGQAEARAYLADEISRRIEEWGIDVYRQDFNIDPLPYWQAADAPERVGMTEIRYIEGLYAFWDDLRGRHPKLAIDGCAAGGRRLDIETCARSLCFWRSDYSDLARNRGYADQRIGDQCQTAGLSRWVPLHSGIVWNFSPYELRSGLAGGMIVGGDLDRPDFPEGGVRAAIQELRRLRPGFLGDFYPLLPLTAAAHDWCAWQCHRPSQGDGFAVFLRRHASPFPGMQAGLRALDPSSRYKVAFRRRYEIEAERVLTGRELSSLELSIPECPGSLLLEYAVCP